MSFEETFLQALKQNREDGEKLGIAKAIAQMVKEMIKKQSTLLPVHIILTK